MTDSYMMLFVQCIFCWPYLAFTPHLFQLAHCCQPQVFKNHEIGLKAIMLYTIIHLEVLNPECLHVQAFSCSEQEM